MKHYNKKIEITRVHQHFILEWDDVEKREKEERESSGSWPYRANLTSGTEIFSEKEKLFARLKDLL